jgi:phage shock protein PspC (stress-responsive transcriptional regulator)
MQKITSIHLNGKAYQLEEEAYQALRRYLDQAGARLAGNLDMTEIMSDVEQAIGEKCQIFLRAGKDVVTGGEMGQILQAMGPVEENSSAQPPSTSANTTTKKQKRLFLLLEGEILAGVCTGLAAYFDTDVVWIRLTFVGLTLITGGGWILLYLALAFIVPYASTVEEKAMAHGEPINTQEIINRARETYDRVAKKHGWKE